MQNKEKNNMRRYIMLLFFLMILADAASGQSTSPEPLKVVNLGEINQETRAIHRTDNSEYSTDVIGDVSNDIVYTFKVLNRSTLFTANMMRSQFNETYMYLFYRPLGSAGNFRGYAESISGSWKAEWLLEEKSKFGQEFEEDLTQIHRATALLYCTLEPGEYALCCEPMSPITEKIRKGNLRVNIYFSPLGCDKECAIDLGSCWKSFDIKKIPGTFGKGKVYYKFNTDSISRVNIVHQGPLKMKPTIELYKDGNLLTTSANYPLKEDSIPQIIDYTCGKGEFHIGVTYEAENVSEKVGLQLFGLFDTTGDNWTKPFEMGTYSDSLRYTHIYSPRMFDNLFDDNISEHVFHRFTIKDTMDISIATSNYLLGITLYDEKRTVIQHKKREEYMTSLDKSSLPPGTYYFTTEGSGYTMVVNVAGRKSYQRISTNKNYVTTMKATTNTSLVAELYHPQRALQKGQYMDAFGRLEQELKIGVSPLMKDLVSVKEYDRMYRDSCSWLPVISSGAGTFQSLPQIRMHAIHTYNDHYAYTKSTYEDSPLNRLIEKYSPGSSWHTTGHSEKNAYPAYSPASGLCRIYEAAGVRDSMSLIQKGVYASKELTLVKQTNEEGHPIYLYSNKLGQQVLSRIINGTDTLDTYQVYDDFGNLTFVLPPMAVSCIDSLGTERALDLYAYQYRYSKRNMIVGKKMPGAAWVDYAYSDKGELFGTRDEEMRKRGEWLVNFYDFLGRKAFTAIYKYPGKFSGGGMIYADFDPEALESLYGYTIYEAFTLKNFEVQQVFYYDNYEYKKVNDNFTSILDYITDPKSGCRYGDDTDLTNCKGKLTGTMTRIIGTDQMLCASTYYDYYQRPVQVRSTDINGKVHVLNTAYDFCDNIVSSNENVEDITIAQNMAYDHAGRLLNKTQLINSSLSDTLIYAYDELGRLSSTTRSNGNNSFTSTNSYNLRGWLTSIDSPLFSERLYYTDGVGTPRYNGNISSMTWQTSTDPYSLGYCFEYDSLSRLKNAVYGEGTTLSINTNRFNEQITGYDKNGNIQGLKRYGQLSSGNYGLVDNLSIFLNGNQLKKVDDCVLDSVSDNNFEFKDGTKQDIEYFYDANGNLTKDLNKKITCIQYNYLNLPDRIEFEGGNSISYLYDATGSKQRTIHQIAGNTTTTDYCSNVIYENGIPKMLLTEGGFVSLNDNKYHYYLQDHQGNNRIVADQDGKIEEVNHYYPFGGTFASTASTQPYKYNGKELDRKGGLDWYDYGARTYDPMIGRWHAVDPSGEKYYNWSPYSYCKNNPVLRIDLDGKDDYVVSETGKMTQIEGETSVDVLYTYSGDENDPKGEKNIQMSEKGLLKDMVENQKDLGGKKTFGITSNLTDAANLFQFVAENTKVEWSLSVFKSDKKSTSLIATNQQPNRVNNGNTYSDGIKGEKVVAIHSHPDPEGTKGGYGNDLLYANPNSKNFVYFQANKTFYEYNNKKQSINATPVAPQTGVYDFIKTLIYK